MYSNSAASPCSDPAFRQQGGHFSLPSIPEDLVQPLRDALPKIDEALLSSVPEEALPLCQQLFSAWLSTTSSSGATHATDIPAPPPRAQTTMNIASLCQPSSSLILSQEQQKVEQHHIQRRFAETTRSIKTEWTTTTTPKQCRKSQSTSRLSSWFSWSLPKRKSGSVAPMLLGPKKFGYQNISDASPPPRLAIAKSIPLYAPSSGFSTTTATTTKTTMTVPRINLCQRQPPDSYILQKQLPQTPPLSQTSTSLRRHPPPQLPQRPQSQQTQSSRQQLCQLSQSSSSPTLSHFSHPRQAIHQNNTRPSHHSLGLSPSLSPSSSTTAPGSTSSSATFLSRANNGGTGSYRRSFSFMLSKLGTKVRRVIHSSSQRIHPQHKPATAPTSTSTSNMLFSSLSQFNLPELHNLPPVSSSPCPTSSTTSQKKPSSQCLPMFTGSPSVSSSCQFKTDAPAGTVLYDNAVVMEQDNMDSGSSPPTNGNGSVQQTYEDDNEYNGIHPSLLLGHPSYHCYHSPSISSWKEVTYDLPQSSPSASKQPHSMMATTTHPTLLSSPREHFLSNSGEYSDYSEYDSANDDDDHGDRTDAYHHHLTSLGQLAPTSNMKTSSTYDNDDGIANLKTPWSPPASLARRILRSSKTDTNMKHKVASVPFIKMGLGRKSLDVDDQAQYTTRSISSTSFTLQWQEKFHDQQQPRERIANTLKSVSLALYDIVRHNHAYQQFTSDTAYVAHPDLTPGEATRELFATVPMTHWRDIFDQMAYIFENGVLTAEHAIITVIYIERMLENSKQHLCEANWRLIVLAGLITSIKVWDDCAVHNKDFLQIFPELDIKHVNLIERRFLEHIDWDVSVRCSLFASTYFELQEHR